MAATVWLKDSQVKIGGGKVCIAEACPCGPPMETASCITGCSQVPVSWLVDLSAFALVDAACACCDDIGAAGVVVLTKVLTCDWRYQFPNCGGSGTYNSVRIYASGGIFILEVTACGNFITSFVSYFYDPPNSPSVPCPGPFSFSFTSTGFLTCTGTYPLTVDCEAAP